jgi:putative Holliday junction resolvase
MSSILALDIGEKRTGVAIAEPPIYLAHPIATVDSESLNDYLIECIMKRDVHAIVIGFPRNQRGEVTAQTAAVQDLVSQLQLPDDVTLHWQDESLTSIKAEEELTSRGKPFEKGDIDSLAATYILEDYLKEHS